ncbi:MAG: Hpt domain-containing protein [Proteobacteria bacterium]|jgi:HPt (histidine-containing phosphotransfer) domain-containing protein|nr:Hpt domain-containing protein [Alphaproteobacteria bacterium]NCC02814.1 Hpt domain-containing protein [Pseudomonadota bacterium]
MTEPVNLDNLHDMTGGNAEVEKELFNIYLSSSGECLKALQQSTADEQQEIWRTQAHAWKGMSLNLGAEPLGKLCAAAQIGHTQPQDKKRELLAQIEEEYRRVKTFLSGLL